MRLYVEFLILVVLGALVMVATYARAERIERGISIVSEHDIMDRCIDGYQWKVTYAGGIAQVFVLDNYLGVSVPAQCRE